MTKFNKQNKTKLNKAFLYILYCVFVNGGDLQFVSASRVTRTLRFIKMAPSYSIIKTYMLELADKGYLIKNDVPRRLMHYKLSLTGLNILNSFETCLKKERWNR